MRRDVIVGVIIVVVVLTVEGCVDSIEGADANRSVPKQSGADQRQIADSMLGCKKFRC
jgi:hypothetical protein